MKNFHSEAMLVLLCGSAVRNFCRVIGIVNGRAIQAVLEAGGLSVRAHLLKYQGIRKVAAKTTFGAIVEILRSNDPFATGTHHEMLLQEEMFRIRHHQLPPQRNVQQLQCALVLYNDPTTDY